jgi:hypothetical protein
VDSKPTEPDPPIEKPKDGRFYPFNLKWYPVVNDLVGGWAVSHIDKPLSEQDPRKGEGDIADSLTKEIAEYICLLHNTHMGIPEGWTMCAVFPLDRYFIRLEEDGYNVYVEDDHGAFT